MIEEKLNQEAEELVKRTEVLSTPFTIIETDGKMFGVLGKYRITEPYLITDDEEQEELDREALYNDLKAITWNRILQVFLIMKEQEEELNKFLNED